MNVKTRQLVKIKSAINIVKKNLSSAVNDLGQLLKAKTDNTIDAFKDQTIGLVMKLDPTGMSEFGYGLMKAMLSDLEGIIKNKKISEIVKKYQNYDHSQPISCEVYGETYQLVKTKNEIKKKMLHRVVNRRIEFLKEAKVKREEVKGLSEKITCQDKVDSNGKVVKGKPRLVSSVRQVNSKYYEGQKVTTKYACDYSKYSEDFSTQVVCPDSSQFAVKNAGQLTSKEFVSACSNNWSETLYKETIRQPNGWEFKETGVSHLLTSAFAAFKCEEAYIKLININKTPSVAEALVARDLLQK